MIHVIYGIYDDNKISDLNFSTKCFNLVNLAQILSGISLKILNLRKTQDKKLWPPGSISPFPFYMKLLKYNLKK